MVKLLLLPFRHERMISVILKVTVQFETERYDLNKIIGHIDSSEVKPKNSKQIILISLIQNKILK